MSDGLRYERYVWFHGQVKADRFPNSRHISEEFEISNRTARRDVEFMRFFLFAPLSYNHSRKGCFYTNPAYELPPHWISETNILSLALAVRLASTIPDHALKDDLCQLIEQVAGTENFKQLSDYQCTGILPNTVMPAQAGIQNTHYAAPAGKRTTEKRSNNNIMAKQ